MQIHNFLINLKSKNAKLVNFITNKNLIRMKMFCYLLKKYAIPAILVGVILVAGIFATTPIQQASTVHDEIIAAITGAVGSTTNDSLETDIAANAAAIAANAGAIADLDGDGVPNVADNCPLTPNGAQTDVLVAPDGIGDACQLVSAIQMRN